MEKSATPRSEFHDCGTECSVGGEVDHCISGQKAGAITLAGRLQRENGIFISGVDVCIT